MIAQIESIRGSGADVASGGIGGTINIVLKEGVSLEGGFAKLSGQLGEDDKFRGSNTPKTAFW